MLHVEQGQTAQDLLSKLRILKSRLWSASCRRSDELAAFSNYHPTRVHLAAPGVDMISTFPTNTYASMSGTSMATPVVAGAAALALAAAGGNGAIRPTVLRALLLNSTDSVPGLAGKVLTGVREPAGCLCSSDFKFWWYMAPWHHSRGPMLSIASEEAAAPQPAAARAKTELAILLCLAGPHKPIQAA